jgi:hypothetical protein
MSKKLSKRIVEASLLAAAMGVAGGANALTLGTAPSTSFAIELNYNSLASTPGTPITVPAVTTPLGFGVTAGANNFVRIVVANATFDTAVTGTNLTDTTTAFASSTVVSGGAGVSGTTAGSSCVVFQVQGAATTGNTQSDTISFASPALDVASNTAGPVTFTYTLHETAVSASCTTGNNTTILNTPVTGTVASFANSLNFTAATTYTDTADVEAAPPFTAFASSTSGGADAVSTTNAGLANIVFGIVSPATTDASGASITLGTLISAATMTVGPATGSTANFAASTVSGTTLNGVNLDTTSACSSVSIAGTQATATSSVTFTVTAGTNSFLCYAITGKTVLPAGGYSASLALTAQSNVLLESVGAINVGSIVHNGTTIATPWFTIFPGYTSRFVLTNSGTTPAPYTTTVITETGVTHTAGSAATGTIAPGSTLVLDANTVTSAFSSGTRGSVIFNIAAPSQNIIGEYQVIDAANGAINTYKLHSTNQ